MTDLELSCERAISCERAMRRGVFGAPTFTAREETFRANDRLAQAIAWAWARSGSPSA